MWFYYWERYGYERASGFFLQQYVAEKGHINKGRPDMVNVIGGKLDYLEMVKGADVESCINLRLRFSKLIKRDNLIDRILNAWETDGIEEAMNLFDRNEKRQIRLHFRDSAE